MGACRVWGGAARHESELSPCVAACVPCSAAVRGCVGWRVVCRSRARVPVFLGVRWFRGLRCRLALVLVRSRCRPCVLSVCCENLLPEKKNTKSFRRPARCSLALPLRGTFGCCSASPFTCAAPAAWRRTEGSLRADSLGLLLTVCSWCVCSRRTRRTTAFERCVHPLAPALLLAWFLPGLKEKGRRGLLTVLCFVCVCASRLATELAWSTKADPPIGSR